MGCGQLDILFYLMSQTLLHLIYEFKSVLSKPSNVKQCHACEGKEGRLLSSHYHSILLCQVATLKDTPIVFKHQKSVFFRVSRDKVYFVPWKKRLSWQIVAIHTSANTPLSVLFYAAATIIFQFNGPFSLQILLRRDGISAALISKHNKKKFEASMCPIHRCLPLKKGFS